MLLLLALAAAQFEPPPQPSREAQAARPPSAAPDEAPEVSAVVVSPLPTVREPQWAAKLNLDPTGRFSRSETPYLERRPENGCKARAGGSVSPSGETGVATGLACAWKF